VTPGLEPRNLSRTELGERVKTILESKGLTLSQCSQRTRYLYGRSSPRFVPHNFYYELASRTFSPSLHQVFALSKITGYSFYDWLRVFGFDPEDISRLQSSLSSKRTVLLDPTLGDPEYLTPWFRNGTRNVVTPAIAPLGRLLELGPSRRLRSIVRPYQTNFMYVKVGREDALAFPDLLPGSIVRADTYVTQEMLSSGHRTDSKPLFLIEHSNGLNCCRLQMVGKNHVIPLSGPLPYAQVELQLHEEARVLGILDFEIRPLLKSGQPEVPAELAKHWRPLALRLGDTKLSKLLRTARLRAALSFREASAMSGQVAAELRSEQYFAAPGSLSDYEASDVPPRHVHKAITLCAIYGLQFSTFLQSIGIILEDAGNHPIPDRLIPRKLTATSRRIANETDDPVENGFLALLLRQSGPVPFFLRGSLSELSGLTNLSLHDFFWVGGEAQPLHPLLTGGLVVIVNRHRKKPIYSRSKSWWQQRIYVLLRRNGTYLCGCCSLENGILLIHPFSSHYRPQEQLRNHEDAEVVGEIVLIARTL
jgi:transcriptional regulator with XRE-family HTH domain